jgi:two-component system CheB/CheR fusion protein
MKQTPAKSAKSPHHAVKSGRTAAIFPVVGVGASAGGLEAFRQLLENLPTDTGMAFVLVQHLDPDHPSALAQLLARCTAMPVGEAQTGSLVEPNRVYVIAPNTSMVIARRRLKLQPRAAGTDGRRPINLFFESLAQEEKERAIGVVLSGTASDGTLGLEAIKAEGGITFAQDETAKYDSMPRSAVEAGCVDFVLSPEKMANELTRIARHPWVAPGAVSTREPAARREAEEELLPGRQGVEPDFKKILLLLRNHTGVDFSSYKFNTIFRRLSRRIVLNQLVTLDDYARFLRNNSKELDALFSDVLINVTGFFRNPEVFEALKRKVFPALAAERRDEPVRIWVPGCSSGQEVYSLAMAYLEHVDDIPRAPRLQIFATDLHERMLDKARMGTYLPGMVEGVSPERLQRFFTEKDGSWRVVKPLRDTVVFARQNVLNDPPFSRMDLISCRNLLIYLDSSLQKRLLPAFHYALKPKGFLLLGASESIGPFTGLFDAVDKKCRIFARKPAPTRPLHLQIPPRLGAGKSGVSTAKPSGLADGSSSELNTRREADRVALFRYAAPGVLVDSGFQVLQFRGDTSPWLKPPPGKAAFHLLRMARAGLMLPLRAGINKARKENKAVRREKIKVSENGDAVVNLEIIPLKNLKERHYLVFFESASAGSGEPASKTPTRSTSRDAQRKEDRRRIAVLEQELAEARDYLRSMEEQAEAGHEELQASNEEIISANEELQSVNEELETAKEELEATNEELTTVNEEMSHRNSELGQLNNDLVNFQNSAELAILSLDRNLAIRRFTPQAAQQFNLMGTDVGRPITGLRHNLELADLEEIIVQVMETGDACQRETRDKNGRWQSLRVFPYLNAGKQVEGAVMVVVDIDAVKKSALHVAEQHEYADAIVRSAPIAFVVLEPDFRVHYANAAFYQTFKTIPALTEGHSLFEIGDGQWSIPRLRQMLVDVIPRKSFFDDFEVSHEFKNIGRRTMLLNARLLQSHEAQPERILLGISDITGRLVAEEAQKVLASIVECSADAILSKDLDGKILSWNEGAVRLFGYTAEEVVGQPIYRLIPEENRSDEAEILGRVTRGERVFHYETARRRKDGTVVEISLSASPIRDASDRIIGASTIARDIGERKKADAALREAKERLAGQAVELERLVAERTGELTDVNKHLEAFVYTIAHDLRAPLRAMQGFSTLLLEESGPALGERGRDFAGRICKSAQFMDALLRDLLAFSRVSQQRVELRPVALHSVVQTALSRLEGEIREKQAVVDDSGTWPAVLAHEVTLTQVMVNLIGNALKFIAPEVVPMLRLRAEESGDYVRVWVEDNGIGIALPHHEQIFRLFTRLGGEAYPGTGLGLAIVQKGIERMGGRVGLESTLGAGSRFWFELRKA